MWIFPESLRHDTIFRIFSEYLETPGVFVSCWFMWIFPESLPHARIFRIFSEYLDTPGIFFFLYMFLANERVISHSFLLCRPSQRSARSQVPSQVATHQMISCQRSAGEIPDSNPGLQDNSQARYHWATMPPRILATCWNIWILAEYLLHAGIVEYLRSRWFVKSVHASPSYSLYTYVYVVMSRYVQENTT
jgi:hypothetical protein